MFSSERLKGIDVFVCVADMGSFTAAAERLNLTTSAISKGIARLESRLQTRLFTRTTRRLSLTDAGLAFYRTCTRVLAELEEAEVSMQANDAEPRGRIRIDLPAAYGRVQVLPVILHFIKEHALLVPHISFSDRFVDPIEEDIDITVRIGGSDVWPDALGHRYVGTQRYAFCASPAYLAQHGEPVVASDLDHHSCIVYRQPDGLIGSWHFPGAAPGLTERKVMDARIAVGDAEGQLIAAMSGHGITQLPTWLVRRQLNEGSLREVLPDLSTDGLSINLIWIKSRQMQPKVSALLDELAAHLTTSGGASAISLPRF